LAAWRLGGFFRPFVCRTDRGNKAAKGKDHGTGFVVFDRQPTPPKVRRVFVALVCFVVERLWLLLNHEWHEKHEGKGTVRCVVSVAPAGAGLGVGHEPTADAVGYRLSVLRT
jgi:hypothetical protein